MTLSVNYEQLFLRAAAIVETDGWKQGMMFDNGACCALGAVWLALAEQRPDLPKPLPDNIGSPANRKLALPVDDLEFLKRTDVIALTEGRHLLSWNELICRSQAEMVAKLREIATVVGTDDSTDTNLTGSR